MDIDIGARNQKDKFVIIYETNDRRLQRSAVSADWQMQGDGFVFVIGAAGHSTYTSKPVRRETVQKLGQPSVEMDSGHVKITLKKLDKNVEDITSAFD